MHNEEHCIALKDAPCIPDRLIAGARMRMKKSDKAVEVIQEKDPNNAAHSSACSQFGRNCTAANISAANNRCTAV